MLLVHAVECFNQAIQTLSNGAINTIDWCYKNYTLHNNIYKLYTWVVYGIFLFQYIIFFVVQGLSLSMKQWKNVCTLA